MIHKSASSHKSLTLQEYAYPQQDNNAYQQPQDAGYHGQQAGGRGGNSRGTPYAPNSSP